MKNGKVLVIGAAGFLGRALVSGLKNGEYEVVAASYRGGDYYTMLGQLRALCQSSDLRAVVNAGACQSTKDDIEGLKDLVNSNVFVPACIASELRNAKVGAIPLINFGSSWQIGTHGGAEPFNAYAATKTAAEAFMDHFAQDGLAITTLRLYDTYGAGDSRNKIVNLIIDAFIESEKLEMSGGEQFIDLVHIDDVVKGVIQLISEPHLSRVGFHDIYSVRSGSPIQVIELVKRIATLMGRTEQIGSIIKLGALPYRKRERFTLYQDTSLLPGWEPSVKLDEGLKGLIEDRRVRKSSRV
jgi:CDP-paratose synthetase